MNPSATIPALSGRARGLKETFDAAFARPPPPPPPPAVALLFVRAGGERFAVKRTEMTGLVHVANFATAPGPAPAFLGVAALNGEVYPVWSLARLLGRMAGPAGIPARGGRVGTAGQTDAPCAFACETFERLAFVPEAGFAAPASRAAGSGNVQALVPWDSALVPVVNLPALRAEIHHRKQSTPPRNPPP